MHFKDRYFLLIMAITNIDIKSRLAAANDLNTFASLLQSVKLRMFNSPYFPITAKQLRDYAFCNRQSLYHKFPIAKKTGGTREISAPTSRLKTIQRVLNELFSAVYTPSTAARGFAPGRSIVGNASFHIGMNYVFNIDLSNFFPSIRQGRVWARLQLAPFNLSRTVVNVVAYLCCAPNDDDTDSVLPQGAPTSPLLSNAVCDQLDRKIQRLAKKYGVRYTRYADDMTFSSMHNVYQIDSDFRRELMRIIDQEGFVVNDKKTRLQRDGQRQEVTGLVVNEKINLDRSYVHNRLRCIINKWEKEGYKRAYAYFYKNYKRDKGYIKKGEPVMENVIDGMLNYMAMVKGKNNSTYLKLQSRFDRLQPVLSIDEETDSKQSYTFVETYTIGEFEKLFDTTITLKVSSRLKLIGECFINQDTRPVIIKVGVKAQANLCDMSLATLEPDTTIPCDKLQECYIALCRHKCKNFWLISDKPLEPSSHQKIQNAQLDIDKIIEMWEKDGFYKVVTEFHNNISFGATSFAKSKEIAVDADFENIELPPEEIDIFANDDRGYTEQDGQEAVNGPSTVLEIGSLYGNGTNEGDQPNVATPPVSDHDEQSASARYKLPFSVMATEFVRYLLRNKRLTNYQRVKVEKLLAENGLSRKKSKTSRGVDFAVSQTVEFFKRFNNPMGLKYLTHDFDPTDDGRPHSLPQLISQANSVMNDAVIPQSLCSLVKGFIDGGVWIDTYGKQHDFNLNATDVIQWSKQYNMHPISSEKYAAEIAAFRATVRLVAPALKSILDELSENSRLNVVIDEKVANVDFYVNTYILRIALKRILEMMKWRANSCPNVTICCKRAVDHSGNRTYQLIISQKNSKATGTLDDVIERLRYDESAGDFGDIRNMLNGYCYWSVEAIWGNEPWRWNILRDSTTDEKQQLQAEDITGFTHIFTFYR